MLPAGVDQRLVGPVHQGVPGQGEVVGQTAGSRRLLLGVGQQVQQLCTNGVQRWVLAALKPLLELDHVTEGRPDDLGERLGHGARSAGAGLGLRTASLRDLKGIHLTKTWLRGDS